MRVAYYEKTGPAAEVLHVGDVETPSPMAGEVRVRLKTSGINPSDVKSRSGLIRRIAYPLVIPHSDGAGEIDMVGEGVSAARIGERVWTLNAQWKRPWGTAAEFVVLPENLAVRLPVNANFEAGASLGIPALTAWEAIDFVAAPEGKFFLVHGGAGAVGHYATQFAKRRKAKVITTVSSAAKAKIAQTAGADYVIDYTAENVAERVMAITGKSGVDAVIEVKLTANAPLLPAVLKPDGDVIVYGTDAEARIPAAFCLLNDIRLQFMLVYQMKLAQRQRAIADITEMIEQNRLISNVAMTLPLEDVVSAHEAVEQGKVSGKVVLKIS
jgi:NADPH2:quinone reductase